MRIEDEKSGKREVGKMGIFELSPLIKEKDRRNPYSVSKTRKIQKPGKDQSLFMICYPKKSVSFHLQ